MSDSTLLSTRRVLPGFTLSLGTTLLYAALILLLPLTSLMGQLSQLSWAEYWGVITDSRNIASYKVTVLTALAASVINMLTGLLLAWVLVRYRFPGRTLLDALIDLPFALPTAVAGITLATLYAPNGALGAWLAKVGITVSYAPLGIIMAMVFTSLPFVVRSVQPILEELPATLEEAAVSLGATERQTFWRALFPMVWPALLTGGALSLARSLGEYGAVIFIAGNTPYKTEVMSLAIVTQLEEYSYANAAALASLVLASSLLLLLFINAWQARFFRRLHGGEA